MFDDRDIIIQCGTPVIWPGCSKASWVVPIWHNAIGRNQDKAVCLNLAAGSCFPWENQPNIISDHDDRIFLESILKYCKLSTVRDDLANELVAELGYSVDVLPCTAFLAGMNYQKAESNNKTDFN